MSNTMTNLRDSRINTAKEIDTQTKHLASKIRKGDWLLGDQKSVDTAMELLQELTKGLTNFKHVCDQIREQEKAELLAEVRK